MAKKQEEKFTSEQVDMIQKINSNKERFAEIMDLFLSDQAAVMVGGMLGHIEEAHGSVEDQFLNFKTIGEIAQEANNFISQRAKETLKKMELEGRPKALCGMVVPLTPVLVMGFALAQALARRESADVIRELMKALGVQDAGDLLGGKKPTVH